MGGLKYAGLEEERAREVHLPGAARATARLGDLAARATALQGDLAARATARLGDLSAPARAPHPPTPHHPLLPPSPAARVKRDGQRSSRERQREERGGDLQDVVARAVARSQRGRRSSAWEIHHTRAPHQGVHNERPLRCKCADLIGLPRGGPSEEEEEDGGQGAC